MKPYKIKIPAGTEESVFFGKGRNRIHYDESSTVKLTVKSPDNNEEVVLQAGADATLSPFEELRLSHDGAADTVVLIYVGKDTSIRSAKIGGTVQVTGGSDNAASPPIVKQYITALNKRSYIAVDSHPLAVTGAVVSIFNPAGSGMTALVTRAEAFNGSSINMGFKAINAVLGGVSASARIFNLSADNANANVCQIYYADIFAGALLSLGIGDTPKLIPNAGASIFASKNGWLLPAGTGLIFTQNGTGLTDNNAVAWDEF